ncbi:MAG TPA: hypothetical protein VF006_11010 [Longimicrobium sp.]
MPHIRLIRTLPLLLLAAACMDEPTASVQEPEPKPGPRPVGIYEITLSFGTPEVSASVSAAPSQALSPTASGVVLESLSAGRVTHGVRNQGGQRYMFVTMRVRNGTAAALSNLTFIPVLSAGSIGATPFTALTRPDGAPADSTLAPKIVPTGSVTIADDGGLRVTGTDVLQVFEESEVAAITLPSGFTGIFPYGFVTRNAVTPGSRTLPATTDPNEYAGTVTFAFRYPQTPTNMTEPATFSFQVLGVEDTETRLTESIEEGHDSVAVRMLRERATALGATTVTVLAGSPALDPEVDDYPGQRQICSVRTAGAAGSPVTYITEPAGYTEILMLRPGESVNACGAWFRTGTPARPAMGVPFSLTATAMDLYGNVMTTAVDSVRLESVSGPYVTFGPRAALVSGQATIQATYGYVAYGTSVLRAVGRRNRGLQSLLLWGVTRTWTGNVSTAGVDGANWDLGAPPGAQDTAYFPAGRPNYVVMTMSGPVGGLILDNGATLDMGSHDLTAHSLVWTGTTGGITSTTGRLILTGTIPGATLKGNLPRMQVTGSYSLAGPVVSRARIEVAGGRLRTVGHRVQTSSY